MYLNYLPYTLNHGNFIYRWQTLIGSIIGAAAPLSIWFIIEKIKSKRESKRNLDYIHRKLVLSVNGVILAHRKINHFIAILEQTTTEIEAQTLRRENFFGLVFFPSFSLHPTDFGFVTINTGSGYLDNKLNQFLVSSTALADGNDDARKQFEQTLERHKDIVLNKIIELEHINDALVRNLRSYVDEIRNGLLEGFKSHIKLFASTISAIDYLQEKGIRKWKRRFSHHGKFFLTANKLILYKKKATERIDSGFQKEADEKLQEVYSKIAGE